MAANGYATTAERLLDQIKLSDRPNPIVGTHCWLWTGPTDPNGYGFIWLGRRQGTHRAAFEVWVEPIPAGRVIDHLCRVHCCFNPDHLEPVTTRENVRRGKTGVVDQVVCINGHDLSPGSANVREYTRRGFVFHVCRTCNRERVRQFRLRRKAS